jgi:hypothetical protein
VHELDLLGWAPNVSTIAKASCILGMSSWRQSKHYLGSPFGLCGCRLKNSTKHFVVKHSLGCHSQIKSDDTKASLNGEFYNVVSKITVSKAFNFKTHRELLIMPKEFMKLISSLLLNTLSYHQKYILMWQQIKLARTLIKTSLRPIWPRSQCLENVFFFMASLFLDKIFYVLCYIT